MGQFDSLLVLSVSLDSDGRGQSRGEDGRRLHFFRREYHHKSDRKSGVAELFLIDEAYFLELTNFSSNGLLLVGISFVEVESLVDLDTAVLF